MSSAIAQAEALMKAGELEPALAVLSELLEQRPDATRARFMSARMLITLGRGAEAVRHLDACAAAAAGAPDPANAHRNLSQLYLKAGAIAEAEALLRRGLVIVPQSIELQVKLADVLSLAERHGEAAGLYREAAQNAPDQAAIWAALGVALQKAGELAEAVSAYRRALDLDAGVDFVYNNLLAAMLELRQAEQALGYCEQWLAQRPGNVEALSFHTLILKETGRDAEVAELLDFDRLVQTRTIEAPEGFSTLDAFNRALEAHVLDHPDLRTPPEDHPTWHHPALKIGSNINAGDCGPVRALEREIDAVVASYFEAAGPAGNHPFLANRPESYKIVAWAAVLEGEGNQHPHIHMSGYLSGCYYVTIPEEVSSADNGADGVVKGGFEVGRPPLELNIRSDFPTRVVKPAEGLMVLFPAYLYHGTIPFKSTQRRVCIAFDIVPQREAA